MNLCVLLHQAFQLIRAVSVLLNFTREEEEMLKQTLEYKVGVSFALTVFTLYLRMILDRFLKIYSQFSNCPDIDTIFGILLHGLV